MTIKVKIVKSDCGRSWVDESNNRWETILYTSDEANNMSLSMMGCRDCIECHRMVNCTNCTNCYDMANCNYCLYSSRSSNHTGLNHEYELHR